MYIRYIKAIIDNFFSNKKVILFLNLITFFIFLLWVIEDIFKVKVKFNEIFYYSDIFKLLFKLNIKEYLYIFPLAILYISIITIFIIMLFDFITNTNIIYKFYPRIDISQHYNSILSAFCLKSEIFIRNKKYPLLFIFYNNNSLIKNFEIIKTAENFLGDYKVLWLAFKKPINFILLFFSDLFFLIFIFICNDLGDELKFLQPLFFMIILFICKLIIFNRLLKKIIDRFFILKSCIYELEYEEDFIEILYSSNKILTSFLKTLKINFDFFRIN